MIAEKVDQLIQMLENQELEVTLEELLQKYIYSSLIQLFGPFLFVFREWCPVKYTLNCLVPICLKETCKYLITILETIEK